MRVLSICIFLYANIQYTNALLQAHGFAHIPVINMLLSGAAKLGIVYILTGNPKLGILGAPIGSVLGYSAIAIMNLTAISKVVPQKPALLKNILRPALPAAIMGAAVFGAYWGLTKVLGSDASSVILCGAPIVVGVAVYGFSVVKLKAITAEDCQLLPKGDKIAKLLKL